jgi:hypothetical protein
VSIVDLFSKRKTYKRDAQAQLGDYDWDKFEQAQQPEEFPLPTGQTFSTEDLDTSITDPWNLYYTYMESVAIPQIEETQTALRHLSQSIPAEMLPEPGDPVDLPKLYPAAIETLGTIKDYLREKLPSSDREVDQFFDQQRQKSQEDRDVQVLDQIDREGYPSELEMEKKRSRPTIRTVPDSIVDEEIDPTEYSSRRSLGKTVAQLFAERR